MEAGSLATRLSGARWRLWALVPILALVGAVSLFATMAGLLARPRGQEPAAGGRARHPARRVPTRRDQDQGHESAARRHHHRHGDRRRCDRPLPTRRRPHARAAALDRNRHPLRLGSGRADLGRSHQLERNPDDAGDPRSGRDASGFGERISRLRGDRLPRRDRARGARARLAPVASTGEPRVARRVHGTHGRPPDLPRARGAWRKRSSSRRRSRAGSAGSGSSSSASRRATCC